MRGSSDHEQHSNIIANRERIENKNIERYRDQLKQEGISPREARKIHAKIADSYNRVARQYLFSGSRVKDSYSPEWFSSGAAMYLRKAAPEWSKADKPGKAIQAYEKALDAYPGIFRETEAINLRRRLSNLKTTNKVKRSLKGLVERVMPLLFVVVIVAAFLVLPSAATGAAIGVSSVKNAPVSFFVLAILAILIFIAMVRNWIKSS